MDMDLLPPFINIRLARQNEIQDYWMRYSGVGGYDVNPPMYHDLQRITPVRLIRWFWM